MSSLPPKHVRFVQEYLIDLNAKAAAVRCGYSPASAHVQGTRLLSDVKIQDEIKRHQSQLAEKYQVTAERVIAELAKIGFANMMDYMRVGADGDPVLNFSELTRDQAAALMEITVEDFVDGRGDDARDVKKVKFRLADKRAALVNLADHLGLFKANNDVAVTVTHKHEGARDLIAERIASISSQLRAGESTRKPH